MEQEQSNNNYEFKDRIFFLIKKNKLKIIISLIILLILTIIFITKNIIEKKKQLYNIRKICTGRINFVIR